MAAGLVVSTVIAFVVWVIEDREVVNVFKLLGIVWLVTGLVLIAPVKPTE